MLTLQKVHELLERQELSKRGRELVLKARDLAPVREVGSNGSNVVTRYQSRKMAREVGLESRHVEYKAALLAEYDSKVLEYFAQPMKLEEFLVGPITGKRYKICHTPDLMLLTEHGVFVDECKPEHRLRTLAAKFPDRYMLKEGRWHSPIWEAFFEPLGIRYRLRLDTEMPTLLVANLEFLADYLAPDSPRVPESSKKLVLAKFDQAVVRELSDLIEESLTTGAGYTADDLYKMIADGELAVDLENDEVYETDRLRVYRDQVALRFCSIQYESRRDPPSGDLMTAIESGARLRYEDRIMEVITATTNSVLVNVENRIREMSLDDLIGLFHSGRVTILPPPGHDPEDPQTEDYLNSLGPELMAEIDRRLRLIERASVNPESVDESERTLRRWKEKIKKAGESFYDQAKALAPKTGLRGNRKTRLNPEVLEAIRVTGKDYYNTKLCDVLPKSRPRKVGVLGLKRSRWGSRREA